MIFWPVSSSSNIPLNTLFWLLYILLLFLSFEPITASNLFLKSPSDSHRCSFFIAFVHTFVVNPRFMNFFGFAFPFSAVYSVRILLIQHKLYFATLREVHREALVYFFQCMNLEKIWFFTKFDYLWRFSISENSLSFQILFSFVQEVFWMKLKDCKFRC